MSSWECDGQKTTCGSWLSPPTFTCTLGSQTLPTELASPQFMMRRLIEGKGNTLLTLILELNTVYMELLDRPS